MWTWREEQQEEEEEEVEVEEEEEKRTTRREHTPGCGGCTSGAAGRCALPLYGNPFSSAFRSLAFSHGTLPPCKRTRKDNVPPGTVLRHQRSPMLRAAPPKKKDTGTISRFPVFALRCVSSIQRWSEPRTLEEKGEQGFASEVD